MKDVLRLFGMTALLTVLIPLPALFMPKEQPNEPITPIITEEKSTLSVSDSSPFYLLDTDTDAITEMTLEEYVIGAVFGEMPASFEDEALKAQAVAVRTYAVRRMIQHQNSPSPELDGAYISNDSTKYQAYFSPAHAEYFYGKDYEKYHKKIAALVKETAGEILVYNGEPIVAAFHSSSSGMTESAENVWGNEVPYLIPVKSAEETAVHETVFTSAEVKARLTQAYDDIVLPENKDSWFEITEISRSGTVLTLSAGNKHLTGQELRTLLSLRSACFDLSCSKENDSFTFTVKGNGHGAGMSQYGAEAMASDGADYKEILAHYYKGTQLVTADGILY